MAARAPRDRDQRIGRDVHRHHEIVETGVDIFAAQLVLVGKADGVDHEIDRFPAMLQRVERLVQPVHVGHIALDQEIAAQAGGQRAHPLLQRLALVAEGQLRTLRGQGPGNAPGKRLVVGQAHDQPALALHQGAVWDGLCRFAHVLDPAIASALCCYRLAACSVDGFDAGSCSAGPIMSRSSGVSASAAFSSAPTTSPSPTSQKKKRAIITPARLP